MSFFPDSKIHTLSLEDRWQHHRKIGRDQILKANFYGFGRITFLERKALAYFPCQLPSSIRLLDELFNEIIGSDFEHVYNNEEIYQDASNYGQLKVAIQSTQSVLKFHIETSKNLEKAKEYFVKLTSLAIKIVHAKKGTNTGELTWILGPEDRSLFEIFTTVQDHGLFCEGLLEELNKISAAFHTHKVPKPKYYGYYLCTRGMILFKLGQKDQAINEFKKALRVCKKVFKTFYDTFIQTQEESPGFYQDKASWLIKMFNVCNKQLYEALIKIGRIPEAIEVIEKVDTFLKPLSNDLSYKLFLGDEIVDCHLVLADCYYKTGHYKMALDTIFALVDDTYETHHYLKFDKEVPCRRGTIVNSIFEILATILSYFKPLHNLDMLKKKPNYPSEVKRALKHAEDSRQSEFMKDEELLWINTALVFMIYEFKLKICTVALNEFYFLRIRAKQSIGTNFIIEKNIPYAHQVISILKKQKDQSFLPEIYMELYLMYRDGFKYYEEALDILMEMLDFDQVTFNWNLEMSYLYIAQNNFHIALEHLEDELKIENSHQIRKELIYNAALCYFNLNNPESAMERLHFDGDNNICDLFKGCLALYCLNFEEFTQKQFNNCKLLYFINIYLKTNKRQELLKLKKTLDLNEYELLSMTWNIVFCNDVKLPQLELETSKVLKDNYDIVGCDRQEISNFSTSCLIVKHFRHTFL